MLIYENDLLVVDKLFYDPRYPTCSIIRIGNDYFMVRNQAQKPIKECDLRPFKAKIATKSNKASFDHQFYFRHMIPIDGYKMSIGRAITKEEFEEIAKEYGLSEEDISKEFEDMKGMIYGDKYTKKYKAVQVRVPIEEAIPLEQKLRKKVIEASNGSPGRVNIRTEWGGYRPGAGRPATGRRKRTYYVTDEEYEKLKEYLQSLR